MTMITPSYLGETIEYSSLHACRSTLEDPTTQPGATGRSETTIRRPLVGFLAAHSLGQEAPRLRHSVAHKSPSATST